MTLSADNEQQGPRLDAAIPGVTLTYCRNIVEDMEFNEKHFTGQADDPAVGGRR